MQQPCMGAGACPSAYDRAARQAGAERARYVRDLPAGVIRMNDECLKLRDHTAGYQTVEDIQAVVGEAIGLHKKPLADDDYIDEAMVRAGPAVACVRVGARACRLLAARASWVDTSPAWATIPPAEATAYDLYMLSGSPNEPIASIWPLGCAA